MKFSELSGVLSEMAESAFFASAPRLHALLCFLVETSIQEPSLRITQRLIAERFLGKGADFDPQIDPVVRVAIGRLRVALERYEAAGLCSSVRFEIPKGGYRVVIHDYRYLLGNDGPLTLMRKPIAVLPLVVDPHINEATSIDKVLYDAFLERLSSLGVALLSNDVFDNFLSDPAQTLSSASDHFGFELILSFRPANVSGTQLFLVQVSHIEGALIWSRQYVDDLGLKDDPLRSALVEKAANDVAGHFGVVRISSGLFDRLSVEGATRCLASLEDYAIYAFRKYELTMSFDWYRRAETSLLLAVERGSDHPLVLAKLAYLVLDQYALTSPVDAGLLTRGLALLSRSRKVDAENSYVLFVDSISSLYQGDYLALRAKIARLIALSPVSCFYRDFFIWADALAGRFDDLDTLLHRLHSVDSAMPSWLWFAPFLEAYASRRFDSCLKSAVSFGCEDLFWSPLMKAIAHWGLGESGRAVQAMKLALKLNSALVDDADHYVSCFVVDDVLRKSLLADIGVIQDALIGL